MDPHCTMPEHGRVDAPSSCCHPQTQTAAVVDPASGTPPRRIWRRAAQNTLVCLFGCTIGDVGVIIGSWIWFPHAPMWAVMSLAIVAGLVTSIALETAWLMRRGSTLRNAVPMALSMSFLSMLAMEVAMNAVDLGLTGGDRSHLDFADYLGVLVLGQVAGFLVPWPYNAWRLKHGKACH